VKQEALELNISHPVGDYLRLDLLGESQEVFAVLCLDASLRKISFKRLFYGSVNACDISMKQLLRYAITQQATSIVIAHNHPLGRAYPSQADLDLTRQIQQACQLVDIHLIDHCIIALEGCFSFAEQHLIKPERTP